MKGWMVYWGGKGRLVWKTATRCAGVACAQGRQKAVSRVEVDTVMRDLQETRAGGKGAEALGMRASL